MAKASTDSTRKFIDAVHAERRRIAELEGKLEAARPQWLKLHAEAEEIVARLLANDDRAIEAPGERSVIHQPFQQGREASLQAELAGILQERDKLTLGLAAELAAAKGRVARRLATVAGDFAAWAQDAVARATEIHRQNPQVSAVQPDDPILAALAEASRATESITDPGALVEHIRGWVARVETAGVDARMFHLDRVLARAAE